MKMGFHHEQRLLKLTKSFYLNEINQERIQAGKVFLNSLI